MNGAMTWWLEHWITTADGFFNLKEIVKSFKFKLFIIKRRVAQNSGIVLWDPHHYKTPGVFWVELVTVQWFTWGE